jgi:YfiH family protein
VLYSALLAELPWLSHGFGTREDQLSQDEMASLRQIHSGVVLRTDGLGIAGAGDALVTAQPRVGVSVRTADCYPILIADRRNRAVAAVHAGWRGTAAGIVQNALRTLHSEFGSKPEDFLAAIGPGIGVCCYEVGQEVALQFGHQAACHLNLAEANLRQLTNAGVARRHIDVLGGCTRCDQSLFYSYRRDQARAGRMISFIQVATGTGK